MGILCLKNFSFWNRNLKGNLNFLRERRRGIVRLRMGVSLTSKMGDAAVPGLGTVTSLAMFCMQSATLQLESQR